MGARCDGRVVGWWWEGGGGGVRRVYFRVRMVSSRENAARFREGSPRGEAMRSKIINQSASCICRSLHDVTPTMY